MQWIWTAEALPEQNAFVRFRAIFKSKHAADARLRITADSRYRLYVNGAFVGFGPVRSWPEDWRFDEYDVAPYLIDGDNVVAVLVNHWGTGNFQYIANPPGMAAELKTASGGPGKKRRPISLKWRASRSPANLSQVPRMSVQLGFDEQFDARLDDAWTSPGYDDGRWNPAIEVSPPHTRIAPRGIPFLTREEILPARVLQCETVEPATQTWTLSLKRYYAPNDRTSNISFLKAFLFTRVWSPRAQKVTLYRPHRHWDPIRVNARRLPALDRGFASPVKWQTVQLRKGINEILVPFTCFAPGNEAESAGGVGHLAEFTLGVRAAHRLMWPEKDGFSEDAAAPWLFLGPFALTAEEEKSMQGEMDYPRVVLPERIHPDATSERFEKIWRTGLKAYGAGGAESLKELPYVQPIKPEDTISTNVFAEALGDKLTGEGSLENPSALVAGGGECAVLHPAGRRGEDVRFLLDFGKEVIGPHRFEIEAEAGTVLDFHGFEFIQPDGRHNLAEGLNNTFRYVCREGWQSFESSVRRGLRYTWITVRNLRRPLRIRRVSVIFSTYPQQRIGDFTCDDQLLNRIWEVGAHSLRCCAEDTYTDCPSYEQTHWVGDARNEALVDWMVNGDPRLWFRCLDQAGRSLKRYPITASQVPSAWENILPAWSFLWMRSCREYLLWTGDERGTRKLFRWVEKNVDGVRAHLNADGLFEMQAWNLFDWAAMDTPSRGVVTHNNCFAVLALNDCAEMADWLGRRREATGFRELAESIAKQINRVLWDKKRAAYIDCIHHDGRRSDVFSQQTQTVALRSGVAKGSRAKRCREIVRTPPKGFVRAGSPFFEFFLLEALATEGKEKDFLDTIRRDWGFMIEQGATTFWEMWSLTSGRLTRSHCHGWSAAPTFFLSQAVLGIEPVRPGCREVRFDPKLGDLRFVRGTVPTPHGPIHVQCERSGDTVRAEIELPKGVKIVK